MGIRISEGWSSLRDPRLVLATGLGAGLLPIAPGTWGSLIALPFAWVIEASLGLPGLLAGIVVLFAVGIPCTNAAIRKLGREDPQAVVVDEIVGQWIVLLAVPHALAWYGVAFVLFRLFDIAKPWPASWADRHVKGGLGVMLDDVIAGLYGAAVALIAVQLWEM